tara:strand:+ start:108 stop:437 length:330 start_codon:yes stop_codon:yes gene_type:complete
MNSKRDAEADNVIRQEVLDGVYAPWNQLPRQHDLAKKHNVAFNTREQALDLMSVEGYFSRKAAVGPTPPSQMTTNSLKRRDGLALETLVSQKFLGAVLEDVFRLGDNLP